MRSEDIDYIVSNAILTMRKSKFKPREILRIIQKRGHKSIKLEDITKRLEDLTKMNLARRHHKRFEITFK